ncbi:GH1 family beta-glucosidase [Oerskovia turbata]
MTTPTFPADFLWGAATSAFQIEGSRTADGAGESVWDAFARRPGAVEGGGDGSLACDSYRRWPEDVAILRELGLRAYRFSIGWSRVMPDGLHVNEAALDHYETFVDALLDAGIEPVLTLNHWDMPQALMAERGWIGRSSVDAFVAYAQAVAARLGDRVTLWITQNEPWIIQLLGYQLGLHAPGIADLAGSVVAGHHVLLAHGRAADAIKAIVPGAQVGVALSLFPCEPATDSDADREAAWGSDGYVNRWFLDPLYGRGYPADTRALWDDVLAREGAGFTLDDVIAPGDEEQIGGRMDFVGVNYYTRRVCAAAPVTADRPFPWAVVGPSGDVARTDEGWEVRPESFDALLRRLHDEYDAPRILITENGGVYGDTPTHDGQVHDNRRIDYLRGHLRAVLSAREAGADVFGYLQWSLLDNFEWALGYRPRFGLVHVDYATGRRTLKDSARFYAEVARTGAVPDDDPQHPAFG